MNNRITCIAMFDDESIRKIENTISILNHNLCKVPYGIENRENNDTLPYHFTISVWEEKYEEEIIEMFKTIKFEEIEIVINNIDIKPSFNNSYNLYFKISSNDKLNMLQKYVFNKLPSEKYNPEIFIPHITIHVDNNYEIIKTMKDKINYVPNSITIKFNKLGLYKIYPAKKIL